MVNQISDVKLLQGDLSEAWREINDDYATVAMRYSLNDKIVDRATGRVVEVRGQDARVELDVAAQVEAVGDMVEVTQDLRWSGIALRPFPLPRQLFGE